MTVVVSANPIRESALIDSNGNKIAEKLGGLNREDFRNLKGKGKVASQASVMPINIEKPADIVVKPQENVNNNVNIQSGNNTTNNQDPLVLLLQQQIQLQTQMMNELLNRQKKQEALNKVIEALKQV